MSRRAYHLNLLMESEKLSSSPIRVRVMLPILAGLAALGIAVWWLILLGQVILAQANESRIKNEIAERNAAHKTVLEQTARINELEAQLSQLDCYSNSIVRRGELLTKLAEAMPLKVQLVKLEIPQPIPPKSPPPPKKKKGQKTAPPAFGPTGYVERASLVLIGRSPKETPIFSLMESLAGESFTNSLVIYRDPRNIDQSPKVRSFKQDVSRGERNGNTRMVTFDIEYRLIDRRFDK